MVQEQDKVHYFITGENFKHTSFNFLSSMFIGYVVRNSDSSNRIHEWEELQTQYSRCVNGNEISRHDSWLKHYLFILGAFSSKFSIK